jgi:UDP-N-acetylmuramate dehydrogenase
MLTASVKNRLNDRFGKNVKFDENLAPYVAYRIGGPADVLFFPETEGDLEWIGQFAEREKIPVTVIGTGTNLLVRDQGIRGIVISLHQSFQHIRIVSEAPNSVLVECGGGVPKPTLLGWATPRGFSGLEFSAGVPGTVGGGIYMNAGTKYGCYGDILKKLRLFDARSGGRNVIINSQAFGYRHQTVVGEALVLSAIFQLKHGDPNLMTIEIARIIAERTEKQPLDFPSCGSTFKNPEGHSAGRLIERAGLKGLRVGGAEISNKHANFILNKGHARAEDVLSLIQIIKDTVNEKFSVALECEVVVIGEKTANVG